MLSLATLFRTILSGLQAVIAPIAARDRRRTPLLLRIHAHLSHTITRFERLLTHWRNNTLPKQRHRPNRTPRPNTLQRLPSGHAWLVRAVDHHNARACASQLQHLLATEDAMKFLAEVPRAARILRPLARALGIPLPTDPPPPDPKPSFTPDQPPNPTPPRLGIQIVARALLPPLFPKTA